MVCNRIPDSDQIIESRWRFGTVNYQHIYKSGGMKKLANYIVKEVKEEIYQQLSLFPEEEQKKMMNYSPSRNLVKPEPEKKKLKNTPKTLMVGEPVAKKGYYIDKESVVYGINPITSKPYLHYTEYRIGYGEEDEDGAGGCIHT